MPDIAMCANQKCPLKNSCYRFRATPNKLWQSYGDFAPKKYYDCDFYLKMTVEEKREVKKEN